MSASREITYCEALKEALHQAMEQDERVFLMGEGVDDPRAIFGSTQGLQERFGPDRVFDIPLSENGMTGVLVGAALTGMRPVMTHQRIDFTLYAMDQIVNHAAKRSYTSGGQQKVPLTIRAIIGKGWGQGTQHSQSLQALFAHIPGLKVVMPSTPADAKGLLLASIKDNNPVIFIEHRHLYGDRGVVPEKAEAIALGKAIRRQEGLDVTIVADSLMVRESLKACEILLEAGISVDLIDLRTIKPFDEELILNSVKKTGRLVVADTGWKTCGVAAEIAAFAAENCFSSLKAPIRRITLPDSPTPNSYILEDAYYPDFRDVVTAVCDIMGKKTKSLLGKISDNDKNQGTAASQFLGPF